MYQLTETDIIFNDFKTPSFYHPDNMIDIQMYIVDIIEIYLVDVINYLVTLILWNRTFFFIEIVSINEISYGRNDRLSFEIVPKLNLGQTL